MSKGRVMARKRKIAQEIATTIERCAQVADEKLKEHDERYGCGPYARAAIESVAAAIRALKAQEKAAPREAAHHAGQE